MDKFRIIDIKKRRNPMGFEYFCEDCFKGKNELCFATMLNGNVTYWCKSYMHRKVDDTSLMRDTCNYLKKDNDG